MKESRQLEFPPIKCPYCGFEYHPSEVFMPDDFTGRPDNLVKDPLGKILYVDYQTNYEPNPEEHFVCENCDRTFVVDCSITYKVRKESAELDFKEESVSLLD